MSNNPLTQLTLRDSIDEVLNLLTGLNLEYLPEQDRFQSITRFINRALRQVALEREWSWFNSVEELGTVVMGQQSLDLPATLRPRILADDAVRLLDENGRIQVWAYFLPRDALHKYVGRRGLWVSVTRSTLWFSRQFLKHEAGWTIQVPVMREPKMFKVLEQGGEVTNRIIDQKLDFQYPDLVIARAAYLYAQSDPVMQPRVQTLEAIYKDMMYQIVERDDRFNDSPTQNEWTVPISDSIYGSDFPRLGNHGHPHADERYH